MKIKEEKKYGSENKYVTENRRESEEEPKRSLFDEKVIGEIIRRVRQERKISIENLAEKAFMSPSYLSQIERGERSMTIDYLNRIADSLDMNTSDLMLAEQSGYECRSVDEIEVSDDVLGDIMDLLESYNENSRLIIYRLLKHMDHIFR